MDSKSDFVEKFKALVSSVDEDFIITVANKGIYKRSLKEIDKKINIEIDIENQTALVGEDANIKLAGKLDEFECSCPSRNICRHMTTALLYAKQNFKEIFKEEASQAKEVEEVKEEKDFSWVYNLNESKALEFLTPKELKEVAFRLNFGVKYEVEQDNWLSVNFLDDGIKVKFGFDETSEEILCSCKKELMCTHRVEAILLLKEKNASYDFSKLYDALEIDIDEEAIKEVETLIFDILNTGLSRVHLGLLERIEGVAVLCHGKNLPHLERLLRALHSELKLYVYKNAGFKREKFMRSLARIYMTIKALKNSKNKLLRYELMGEHKTNYHEVGTLNLSGIGAARFNSGAGFEGITFYFYDEERQKIVTFTEMRPNYYDGKGPDIKSMYKKACNWNYTLTNQNMSKSVVEIKKAKLNKHFRLSSSNQTKLEALKKTNIEEINFEKIMFDDFMKLRKEVEENAGYELLKREENSNVYLLKVHGFSDTFFDSINQKLMMFACDKLGGEIQFDIDYSKENKEMIELIEKMYKKNLMPDYVLSKCYKNDFGVGAQPLVFMYEGGKILNITLEGMVK